jgi:hypothetical protein
MYSEHCTNVYSQNGEDGLLEWILQSLKIEKGYFCEFGAWDGKHLSNCRNLYENGWEGIFIEGDKTKFQDLVTNYSVDKTITLLNEYVTVAGPSSLDSIFRRCNTTNVDVLSIDIDGDDLLIWRSLKFVRPKVVVIEYNATIPFDTRFENPVGENKGNSALSIVALAEMTRYTLVAGTSTNLIFIDEKHLGSDLPHLSLSEVRSACGGLRLYFGYDGELIIDNGPALILKEYFAVPWTKFIGIQPIPKFLRGYNKHQRVRMIFSLLGILVRRPVVLFRIVTNKLRFGSILRDT